VNLAHLRTFEAVVRSGTFSAAARQLRVTPAAVSLQIRLLEKACGLRLFDRVGRRTLVAPAGQVLREFAQRIFALERWWPWPRSSGAPARVVPGAGAGVT
jgi:DNA-binding transcriptional LysR family regulator